MAVGVSLVHLWDPTAESLPLPSLGRDDQTAKC